MAFRCTLWLLAALLVALAGASARPLSSSPEICRGLDCPEFKTVNTTAGIEIRRYKKAKYAGVLLSRDQSYAQAYVKGLELLTDYFGGANEEGVEMASTTPMVIRFPLNIDDDTREPAHGGEGAAGGGRARAAAGPDGKPSPDPKWEFYFFLPYANQASPPTPSDPRVSVVQAPSMLFAIRDFTGFATETTVLREYEKTCTDIKKRLVVAPTAYAIVAEYDPPTQITERLNEIGVLLEDDEADLRGHAAPWAPWPAARGAEVKGGSEAGPAAGGIGSPVAPSLLDRLGRVARSSALFEGLRRVTSTA